MATDSYPLFPEQIPSDRIEAGRYEIRFARTPEELDQILRLRFEIFNNELGEGLAASEATGRDRDPFDDHCHHLMILHKATQEVVGTYRMQTESMAKFGGGFYTDSEYDLTQMPERVRALGVEAGRACIHRDHRNGRVLFLLWRGLATYLIHNQKRYFFGCCSLTSQDEEEGQRVLEHLHQHGNMHPDILLPVRPDYCCDIPEGHVSTFPKASIPRLMKIYLAYGCRICSPPAMDRAFKTIDFLTLLDIHEMAPKTYRELFGDS